MNKKALQALITDFKNYAFVLLAASVFLYIGVVLPDQGIHGKHDIVLMITTILFLAGAFVSFKISLKYKNKLEETENQ